MKNLILLSVLFISFHAHAQFLSGIYSGKLVNDSTKKEQNYQLALSEYKGKITGYAYTTFVVNDTFYYSIKRIKATRVNGNLLVEDVKMLVNNFPESPAKHVKQTNIIPLSGSGDTLLSINGKWQTNQTKEYYSLHGAVDMQKDSDSSHSTLLAHLTELKLIPATTATSVGPYVAQNNRTGSKTGGTAVTANTGSGTTASATTTTNATSGVRPSGSSAETNTIAKTNSNTGSKTNSKTKKNTAPPVAAAYIPYTERGVYLLQELDVVSDSVTLSFYDNGVVDGDMISVYINGQNVISATRLTEAATKKTVSLKSFQSDSVQLILVAENLGSLPPNTGLLVVQDGAKKYEVRFSADLQTNAAIVFRKRK